MLPISELCRTLRIEACKLYRNGAPADRIFVAAIDKASDTVDPAIEVTLLPASLALSFPKQGNVATSDAVELTFFIPSAHLPQVPRNGERHYAPHWDLFPHCNPKRLAGLSNHTRA